MKTRHAIIACGALSLGVFTSVAFSYSGAIMQAMVPVERTDSFDLDNAIMERVEKAQGRPDVAYLFNFSTNVVIRGQDRGTFESAHAAGMANMDEVYQAACAHAAKARHGDFQAKYCLDVK